MMNAGMLNKIKKMQKEMMETQKRLETTEFFGSGGGGAVKVTVLGTKEVKKVLIDKDAFTSSDDLDMLQDIIIAAFNDAFRTVDKETEEAMAPYTQGLGGFGF